MQHRIRFEGRHLEWHVASGAAVFGAGLGAPPDSLNPVTLRAVLEIMPESGWALIFAFVGTLHLVALGINGAAPWTPFVRATAAALNLFGFAVFTAAIWEINHWSSGVFVYGPFVCAPLVTVLFKALRDCFLLRRAWRVT